ncbi:MAG: hypothetical protein A2655_04480 [Candidatus Yanofskybacteria bacterium RIFCSPHIGHO2_01_FULL_43_42]|nr:MAG: hypothetical protein A2655_04480 [Candidatus Yanofskybacteria bacterium RIFCSPHIGHO2_01_FULL_43_42]
MSFDKLRRLTMKRSPPVFVLLVFLFAVASISVFGNMSTSISTDTAPTIAENISLQPPNILNKLSEKDDELARVPVSMGSKEIVYYENRYTILSYKTQAECDQKRGLWDNKERVCKASTRKRLNEQEMVIGLKLLNTETKEVQVIAVQTKITANGVSIVAPNGYQIEIVERPNGIRWNWWNTLYRVVAPANTVVIKNNFPRKETEPVSRIVRGKVVRETKKVVKGFLYVPHSEYFELEENRSILVEAGTTYLKGVVSKAFNTLRERGVKSKTFSNKLVVDVEALSPRFFERLPLLEQGDFTEFQLDPQKTAERVLIILGANRENAWKHTCNRSDACGWVQFTPKTYRNIRTGYPAAQLTVDFKDGAGDHLNSIMSAILLHSDNLDVLFKKFGDKILNDPQLEKYLASSYNGAPKWVHNSLSATISRGFSDWITALSPTRKDSRGGLRKETRDFMIKLDYLIQNDLP